MQGEGKLPKWAENEVSRNSISLSPWWALPVCHFNELRNFLSSNLLTPAHVVCGKVVFSVICVFVCLTVMVPVQGPDLSCTGPSSCLLFWTCSDLVNMNCHCTSRPLSFNWHAFLYFSLISHLEATDCATSVVSQLASVNHNLEVSSLIYFQSKLHWPF